MFRLGGNADQGVPDPSGRGAYPFLWFRVYPVKCIDTNLLYLTAPFIPGDTMGRLDVTITNELEDEFRIEIIKRYGGKKGTLSRAITEAIQIWMRIDEVDMVGKTAMNLNLSPGEREKATKILGKCGKAAIPVLYKIANSKKFRSEQREQALAEIESIMTEPQTH